MSPEAMDLPSIADRLTKLERANHRWKLMTLFLMLMMTGAAAMGANRAAEDPPKEVSAQKFKLVDPDGKTRATMTTAPAGARLRLTGSEGAQVVIYALEDLAGAVFRTKEGAEAEFQIDGEGRMKLTDGGNHTVFERNP